ncbi:T9SS outer membrane translocon Sov/SprA [Catalinimonas niigatensis]|uniref:T9SS outer membrane translocon Sov/SprA n=1 Tax=Catalinimonas niigatensis TaxID=1397264 RepID=UPI0026658022|nr:cell surface protein SprA [Catalinimonas niigatensis]WPP51617.1 cell surface protein SprA [Catalinimonas niigatensis]
MAQDTNPPVDTVQTDTLPDNEYEYSKRPVFRLQDRYGNPISNPTTPSPFQLQTPAQLDYDIQVDSTINYSLYERINGLDYRAPTNLNFDEYSEYQNQQIKKDYFKSRSIGLDGESAVSGKRLIPPIYTTPIFDRLFGGSFVDIRPNGFVTLDFGGRFQRTDNPQVPLRQQRNGNFEFDQQISLNVIGKIGDKLAVTANFDNNNSFDFQNNVKVEYTGYDHEIIQKIELGNVSLPVSNSLITGSQSLFGLKTQLQFGKLFVTSVASVQRGQSESITIESGSQNSEFELRASDYDENRHFFLGHFFRENYESWLSRLPQVTSVLNVTRVEVYVLNRNNNTETLRNIAAFMDLAEGETIYQEDNPNVVPAEGAGPTRNDANQLFSNLLNSPAARDVNQVNEALTQDFSLAKATDFEVITSARKLTEQEFTFNSTLGYISLNRKLQNDEVLAVAFEYTYQGQRYKVGELTEDYQNLGDDKVVFLKLLRPSKINTEVPTWDLMMKNIYSLNAMQIEPLGFQFRVVYRDDRTGIDNPSLHEGEIANEPLIRLLGLDQLNQNNDTQPDGNFDFVEGITINTALGIIIFPVLQPFGNHLEQIIQAGAPEEALVNKYVYDALYETTKADAELITTKNKFFLTGSFQAGSANEIMLPGFNIAEGSVQIIAGNTPLVEGVDFTVDYNLGKVNIINEGVLSSGKRIQISFEKADLFNFQQRTLLGTRLDYRFNDDINLGATVLHLSERPVVTRVAIGSEPTKNTKYGFDFNYRKESRFLTRMVDLLPIVQTKEISSITVNAEFAQLIPGTSNIVDGDGTSYIDDFENTITPFNLNGWQNWQLSATPVTDDERFFINDQLGEGYRRAKLAWYVVDNSAFYIERGGLKPEGIPTPISNHYERQVIPQEVFPNQEAQVVNLSLPVLDLVYFPEERGPYNYNPNLTPEGNLPNPEDNWAGITRAITSEVDFDKTNIEYVEFWLMDPFIPGENGTVMGENNTTGGQLIFNLGSVSEDVIPDDKHFFENGLPEDYNQEEVTVNDWGRTPADQFLTDFFNNSSAEVRSNQDVGFDGIRNNDEIDFYGDLISRMPPAAQAAIQDDPSADNFQYYLGDDLDVRNAQIIERYKNFNGQEGNTPITSGNERFTPSGTQLPDNEDLNRDNTLSDLEEYYEYRINLRPGQLRVGQNYIVDQTVGQNTGVTWYLFRIPIRQPDGKVGNIQGFKSIRYIRTYLTGWRQPAALRFAKFQFVGSQWRRYNEELFKKGLNEYTEPYDPKFTISVVNIEENASDTDNGSPYVVPPGIIRDRDNTSPINRRQNEQSIQLCVEDLKDGDARAAYKNMTLDLINYGKVRMFFHAESQTADDSTVTAFLRLGTDFTENYYEIEVPLVMSTPGVADPRVVWPEENEIDIDLNDLYRLKSQRNNNNQPISLPYTRRIGKHILTVVGRPEMSTVQTVMIGIRNPQTPDRAPKDVCIWANELRVGDFDRTSGWAANARVNAQLADVANITASARHMTFGFGGVQSRISERSREEATEYDVSANVTLDKFLPEKLGLRVPMFVSYEKGQIEPQFDPRDPDIPLEAALAALPATERAEYRQIVTDQVTRRSLNFTNVHKVKLNENARSHFFDLSNFSLSYSYSDVERTNFNTALYSQKIIRAGIGYNYNFPDVNIQPFANSTLFNSPWLALIKDFNFSPLPSTISIRGDVNRNFVKTLYRGADLNPLDSAFYEKAFTFNRIYDLRWNLTQSLSIDYGARAFAIIDEPPGDLDSEAKRDTVFTNLKRFGRMKNFDQALTGTYTIPFDKLPITDWISADVRYAAGYTWRAGAIGFVDDFGNTIENNRDQSLNGKIDMVGLYNKVTLLRDINTPQRGRARRAPPATTPQNNADTVAQEKPVREAKFAKGFLRLLMSLRSINGTYTLSEGTLLPGYLPNAVFFGMDSSFSAPGLPFLLGSQDPEIRNEAVRNGWLTTSNALTMPFQQSRVENINIRANIEPFADFRIQLDFKKTKTGTYQEIYQLDSIVDPLTGAVTFAYNGQNPARIGNYDISSFTLRTAFSQDDEENNSEIFTDFENNRAIIQARLERENPNPGSYDLNSQDVLIPSFLAAYSGQDANDVQLSPFPRIPLPNWRIDYAGLPRLIPELSDMFLSFNITHGYISNYSVSNYTSNLLYGDEDLLLLSRNVEDYPLASRLNENDQSTFAPVYIIQQVTITERFSPLIGLNVRTKGRLTGRISYDTERALALNMSNTQITELSSKAINVNFGFTKSEITLPFRVEGRSITLENDLTFNLGMSFKDTKTVQRKLDEKSTVTNGNINFQVRPTVDYRVNDKLNIQLYFARTINDPRVTNSFKRITTEFGVQARFNLAQ